MRISSGKKFQSKNTGSCLALERESFGTLEGNSFENLFSNDYLEAIGLKKMSNFIEELFEGKGNNLRPYLGAFFVAHNMRPNVGPLHRVHRNRRIDIFELIGRFLGASRESTFMESVTYSILNSD